MYRIYYDDQDAFAGVSPLPYVERSRNSIDFSSKWGWSEQFVLNGKILGNCPSDGASLDDMWERKNRLLSSFKKQFKNFYITDTGDAPIYSGETAIVRNISFEESTFANMLNYSVTLDVWRTENFSGYYGVVEPSDTISFNNEAAGLTTIQRNISAKGLQTNADSAYGNAKAYVDSISGQENIIVEPIFMDAPLTGSMFLEAENISEDRLNGSYSVSQTWLYDSHNVGAYEGVIARTVSETSSETNEISVTVNGSVEGGINTTDTQLRNAYSALDLFVYAEEAYSSVGNGILFDKYITSSVNENLREKSINFSSSYSDNRKDDISENDSFTVTRDLSSNKYCVNGSVTMFANYGTLPERWDKVTGYYSTFDMREFLVDKWAEYGYTSSGGMNGGLDSLSVTQDSGNATIRVGGSMCQKAVAAPSGFDLFSFTVSVRPASDVFIEHAGLEKLGDRVIQQLDGKTRSVYSIQGSATKSECVDWASAYEQLQLEINAMRDDYLWDSPTDGILTQFTIETGAGESKSLAQFSASWSYDGGAIF